MHRKTSLINYEPLIVARYNRTESGTLTPPASAGT